MVTTEQRTDVIAQANATFPEPGTPMPNLDINGIMKSIPHRPPFLLVDRVTRHLYSQEIEGFKNLSMNESFFQGHFPGRPIMPGVLQIEALAQLGGILLASTPAGKNKLAVFTGIDKVRFRRIVIPGDQLVLKMTLTKLRGVVGKALCEASVDGEVTVSGELMFSLIPPTATE